MLDWGSRKCVEIHGFGKVKIQMVMTKLMKRYMSKNFCKTVYTDASVIGSNNAN